MVPLADVSRPSAFWHDAAVQEGLTRVTNARTDTQTIAMRTEAARRANLTSIEHIVLVLG